LQAKSQNTKTMAQETLKSLIAVMLTLSVAEQEQVIAEMQKNVRQLRQPSDAVKQELIANAEAGIAEIERGEYYTNDEVTARMNQRIERRYAESI
jgi:predicted transcriptional regulator